MSYLSDEQIDELILGVSSVQWRKVAMIIVLVMDTCKRERIAIEDEAIASRIYALVDKGQLEGAGNLTKWRFSEVRLPADDCDEA